MSVKIMSGASADELTVDPTSKAARVTLYDAGGNCVLPSEAARGKALINVRQSAATAAGASVWGIHNPNASKTIVIKRLFLRCFFDGTAAATVMRYEVIKATGITVFSGGVAVTPLIVKTGQSAFVAAVRVLDTGLTTTGASFGGASAHIVHGRVTQTTTNFQSTWLEEYYGDLQVGEIELAQNEALLIRQTVTSVIGDNIIGTCEFAERG